MSELNSRFPLGISFVVLFLFFLAMTVALPVSNIHHKITQIYALL